MKGPTVRDVVVPKGSLEWSQSLVCKECGTKFTAETPDLEYDGFRRPGTYFFDGSADAAGLTYHFFVTCPSGCEALTFIKSSHIPVLLRRSLIAKEAK